MSRHGYFQNTPASRAIRGFPDTHDGKNVLGYGYFVNISETHAISDLQRIMSASKRPRSGYKFEEGIVAASKRLQVRGRHRSGLEARSGYKRLQAATSGYKRLQAATSGYKRLQAATSGYKRLQAATSG